MAVEYTLNTRTHFSIIKKDQCTITKTKYVTKVDNSRKSFGHDSKNHKIIGSRKADKFLPSVCQVTELKNNY